MNPMAYFQKIAALWEGKASVKSGYEGVVLLSADGRFYLKSDQTRVAFGFFVGVADGFPLPENIYSFGCVFSASYNPFRSPGYRVSFNRLDEGLLDKYPDSINLLWKIDQEVLGNAILNKVMEDKQDASLPPLLWRPARKLLNHREKCLQQA